MDLRPLLALAVLAAAACSGSPDKAVGTDTDADTDTDTDIEADTDAVLPTLLSTVPIDGAVDVPVDITIVMTFSAPVDGDGSSVELVGPEGAVAGSVAFLASPHRVTFDPDLPLAFSTRYTVRASDDLGSADGRTRGGLDVSFTTAADPDLCGNGVLDPDEVCDDGNRTAGDGCAADCRAGFIDLGTFPDASFVVGQPDFVSTSFYGGAASAQPGGIGLPIGGPVVVDERLFVLDSGAQRILIFDPLPTAFGAEAVDAIGRVGLYDGPTPGMNGGRVLSFARNLCTDGERVGVADWNDYSFKIFDPAPVTDAMHALRLGRVGDAGPTAQAAARPSGCALGGGRAVLVDGQGNRVLLYDSVPTTDDTPASVVLGQPDFVSSGANRGGVPSASTLSGPDTAWTDGERLLVSDRANHRVLLWNTWPTTSGQAADVVLGQPDFASVGAGGGASGLQSPWGVWSNGEMVAIADTGNNRVVLHHVWPASSGRPADAVVGQGDFDHVTAYDDDQDGVQDPQPSPRTLGAPGGLFVHGDALYVSETDSNRVVVFGTVTAAAPVERLTNGGFELHSPGANPPNDPPDDWLAFGVNVESGAPTGYASYATQAHGTAIYNPANPGDTSNLLAGWQQSRAVKVWGRHEPASDGAVAHTVGTLYQELGGGVVPAGSTLRLMGRAYVPSIDPIAADSRAYLVIKCFSADFSTEYCGGGQGVASAPITADTPRDVWRLLTVAVPSLDPGAVHVQAGIEFEQCVDGACVTGSGSVMFDDLTFRWE